MSKFFNYKGFKVEEIEWPYEPAVPGGKVYRFCDPWETIFERLGIKDAENLSFEESANANIFSSKIKGIKPQEDLPELDLSYWPGYPKCRFHEPFLLTQRDVSKYGPFVLSGICTDHSFCKDGKYGIMDADGNVKIAAIYDAIKCICWEDDDCQQMSEFIAQKDGRWGKIGFQNDKPCECVYDSIEFIVNFEAGDSYYGNMFLVEKDGMRGLCYDDKLVLPIGDLPANATKEEIETLSKSAYQQLFK